MNGELIFDLTYEKIQNCGYATHLPVLEFLLDYIQPKRTLEWGMGLYSTPLLIEKTKQEVLSVETTSIEWYIKIRDKFKSYDKFKNVMVSNTLEMLPKVEGKKWDLIFNDGDVDSRHIIAQMAQYWDSVIISHDTQEKQYFYNAIFLRDDWVWMDIMDYSVWTSVLCNKSEILEALSNTFKRTKQYRNGLRNKDFTHDHGRKI